MAKAFQVEKYLSKTQILELYLNLIFVGGDDVNGVELGAIYYFDKSAKDLSIAECAYLAGINHIPNAYKPFSDFLLLWHQLTVPAPEPLSGIPDGTHSRFHDINPYSGLFHTASVPAELPVPDRYQFFLK